MNQTQTSTLPKDTYFVAVKVLLRDGPLLLITHDIFGQWDWPGGRLRTDEFATPFSEVVERKMREELGTEVRYELGEPRVFFRHQRQEHGANGETVRIFAVGYEAKYVDGRLDLGPHHDEHLWVNVGSFRPEEYFEGGWLAGVQDYLRLLSGH